MAQVAAAVAGGKGGEAVSEERGGIVRIVVWWVQSELAWHLPRWLARWAFTRVVTEALTDKYHGMDMADIGCLDALAAWEGHKE